MLAVQRRWAALGSPFPGKLRCRRCPASAGDIQISFLEFRLGSWTGHHSSAPSCARHAQSHPQHGREGSWEDCSRAKWCGSDATWLKAWELSFCPRLQLACKLQMQFLFPPILTSLQPCCLLLQALADKMALPCCFFIAISTWATAMYEARLGLWGKGMLRAEVRRHGNTMGVSMLKVELRKQEARLHGQESHPAAQGPARRGLRSQAASSTAPQEPAGAGQ